MLLQKDDNMPPIRTLVIAAFIGAIAYFALMNFMGSFILSNNVSLPSNLQGFYMQLNLSSVNSPINILTSQGQNMSSQLSNGNIVAGTGSAIGMIASFFGNLPKILIAFINFTAFELAIVGIPTAFAQAAAYGLMILMMVLGIVSAIFIFGV